jgi:exodeoxyribonuclease V alpha subunit
MSDELQGAIERIVYENAESGFFVARLRMPNTESLTTIVGNLMAVSVGDTIRAKGQWITDKRWGRQFRVESYDVLVPTTVHAIEAYLGSGLIAGIGKEYAKRLVNHFGADTLRVIDEEPQKLRGVPGIGRVRAAKIQEAWQTQKAVRSIMLFLQSHGIGVNQAVKIYKRYGDSAVAVLRENPFRLAGEITGVGFKTADKIAARMGIPKEAPYRLRAGLLHVLKEAAGDGHVFLPESDLFD